MALVRLGKGRSPRGCGAAGGGEAGSSLQTDVDARAFWKLARGHVTATGASARGRGEEEPAGEPRLPQDIKKAGGEASEEGQLVQEQVQGGSDRQLPFM